MDTHSRWQAMAYQVQAAFAAILLAGTAQGFAQSAAPGPAWQLGGLDALIHSFLTPATGH
jgi:hypothetical protein